MLVLNAEGEGPRNACFRDAFEKEG